MNKAHIKDIGELINESPEGCKYHRQSIRSLCKAKDVGLETFVECLEEDAEECPYSMLLAGVHYCKHSLRIHIAKNRKD